MRFIDGNGRDFDSFWGCTKYPKCHGSRNIDPDTGKPETDYERDERIAHKYDDLSWGDLHF
jgi:ssDNA-binding Zn-finger/Zn-ribbon topoisomerase 1